MAFSHFKQIAEITDITAPEKLLLYAYAGFADAEGVCWPSRALLSEITRYHGTTVTRVKKDLVRHGFLVLESGGKNRTGRVRLTLGDGGSNVAICAQKGGNSIVAYCAHEEAKCEVDVAICNPMSAICSPEYIKNKPKEKTTEQVSTKSVWAFGKKPLKESSKKEEKTMQNKFKGKSVQDIQKQVKKGSPPNLDKNNPEALAMLWVYLNNQTATSRTTLKLTLKQTNMLATSIKRAGGPAVREAMELCVPRWDEFLKEAVKAGAFGNLPNWPRIEFFVQWIEAAVNMGISSEEEHAGTSISLSEIEAANATKTKVLVERPDGLNKPLSSEEKEKQLKLLGGL